MIEAPKNPSVTLTEEAWRTLMSVSVMEGDSMKDVVSELICSSYPEHTPPPEVIEGQLELFEANKESDGR